MPLPKANLGADPASMPTPWDDDDAEQLDGSGI